MAAVPHAGELRQGRAHARSTRDRTLLRAFLESDRLFAAYAICDLDEREFHRTTWGLAFDDVGRPIAVALQYDGLSPQPLFVMGDPDGISAILRDVLRPRVAYLAARAGHIPAVERHYRVEAGPPMLRMWVDRRSFRPALGVAARLVPAEIADLNRLYDLGFPSWLPASSITNGVYYGVRVGGRLVAAAGTHVVSREAGLAAVGNVMTHVDHRGRGYAKATTSAVTAELLRTCDQVVLNVRADNPPALAAYRALGYREHCRFEERLVHRRGRLWDSIVSPFRRLVPPQRSRE
jgi:ribosomal protein S18 acetylase RimI-like enzyme